MTKERAQEPKDGLKCPEWRLYANFLHRELARLWYGKKSVFTLIKGDDENEEFWDLFAMIWAMLIQAFGVAHGLTHGEIVKRAKIANKEYDKLSGVGLYFSSPFHENWWFVHRILGDKRADIFLYDFQITEIINLAACAHYYASEGKMPPYVEGTRLHPLEFYEGLPVAPELEAQFYGKGLA